MDRSSWKLLFEIEPDGYNPLIPELVETYATGEIKMDSELMAMACNQSKFPMDGPGSLYFNLFCYITDVNTEGFTSLRRVFCKWNKIFGPTWDDPVLCWLSGVHFKLWKEFPSSVLTSTASLILSYSDNIFAIILPSSNWWNYTVYWWIPFWGCHHGVLDFHASHVHSLPKHFEFLTSNCLPKTNWHLAFIRADNAIHNISVLSYIWTYFWQQQNDNHRKK